ncbi:Tmem189, partial [Symbiodinium necroappetens]
MVLDLCPELYDGGKEHLLWHPENEETQRRRWLAPNEAPKPVAVNVPKAVPATIVVPASSQRTQRTMGPSYSYVVGHGPGRELSRTYASARSVAGCQAP